MKKTKKILKVKQLENKNQFLIIANDGVYFQSYSSLIAYWDYAKQLLTVGCDWDYSNTTRKHLYIFIKEYCYLPEIDAALYNTNNKAKTIIKLIKDGVIEYDPEMR